METPNNKLIYLPTILRPVGKGIIIHRTTQYTKAKYGAIILPQGDDQQAERKYDVGEVISVGDEVVTVSVGDIVVWQISTGFRIPNGPDEPNCWKVEEFPMSVVAILPNLDPEKRSAKWDGIDPHILDEYVEMWEAYKKELEAEAGSSQLSRMNIPTITRGEIDV